MTNTFLDLMEEILREGMEKIDALSEEDLEE
jgi:hypothetical protein